MDINKILLLAQAGDIQQVLIHRVPMTPGKWQVQFERKSTGEHLPLTARRQNIRHFASADSAIKVLDELGIKSAVIDWN